MSVISRSVALAGALPVSTRLGASWLRGAAFVSMALCSASSARAQIGAILAPGPLSKAHASLEGVARCGQCHELGHELSAAKCLKCHEPIARRIANKTGIHRAVTDKCATCHPEHRGADAELRRIDIAQFDHAVETGFPLQGRHAPLVQKCAACHKRRSFLEASTVCSGCHKDAHTPTLGSDCTRCHSTSTPFKDARAEFDHTRAQFGLTGAHRTVVCEKCHVRGVFRGLRFSACTPCHQVPHRRALGPSCATCHTTERWMTRTLDHTKTGFTLVGAHERVDCAKCHPTGLTKPLQFDRCAACHDNVHRESLKDDCRTCHTETSFRGATFDHAARTKFALLGKHVGLACRTCHKSISAAEAPLARKVVDYGGVNAECATCHIDQHKGEYGRACDGCHRTVTFKTAGFTHPRVPEFYLGRHTSLTCAQCHLRARGPQPTRTASSVAPARAKTPSMACVACHADVHLGQVGSECERCHAIEAAKFAAVRFSHERVAFPLAGKHRAVECAKCHPVETRVFPAGAGTARRLNPVSSECRTCHQDPHLGQTSKPCKTCHGTETFKVPTYTHNDLPVLFTRLHTGLPCRSCHKSETGEFPGGRGTAVRFTVGRACSACHPQY